MRTGSWKQRSILLFSIVTLLCGCKIKVVTEANLSELLHGMTKEIKGDLYVEVSGCSSHEDSRKPSRFVLEAQQKIPSIFKDAEYVECFSKEFDSFAHFTVPVVLGTDEGGKMVSDDYLNILSSKTSLLEVGVPGNIKSNVQQLDATSLQSYDLEVTVKVMNDTGQEYPFKVISAYVESKPFVYGVLTSQKGGAFTVKLSDVSVDNAFEYGISKVLLK